MTPKKTILRELSKRHAETDGKGYTRPADIQGFERSPEKYQKAVNELLQARLVEGQKDAEGRMTIAVNQHRMRDVQREIRPVWMRPVTWIAVIAVAAAVGLFAV